MKNLRYLEGCRVRHHSGEMGDHHSGAFVLPYEGADLCVIAGCGEGWDHVSVSLEQRCPTWDEVKYIKERFFDDAETVMQLHPAKDVYISQHPYVLHLWRPHDVEIPMPLDWMV